MSGKASNAKILVFLLLVSLLSSMNLNNSARLNQSLEDEILFESSIANNGYFEVTVVNFYTSNPSELSGDSVQLYGANDTVHLFWFDTSGGDSTPQSPHEKTKIEIYTLSNNSDFAQVFAQALNQNPNFQATVFGFSVEITTIERGDFSDATSTAKSSEIGISVSEQGETPRVLPEIVWQKQIELEQGGLHSNFMEVDSSGNVIVIVNANGFSIDSCDDSQDLRWGTIMFFDSNGVCQWFRKSYGTIYDLELGQDGIFIKSYNDANEEIEISGSIIAKNAYYLAKLSYSGAWNWAVEISDYSGVMVSDNQGGLVVSSTKSDPSGGGYLNIVSRISSSGGIAFTTEFSRDDISSGVELFVSGTESIYWIGYEILEIGNQHNALTPFTIIQFNYSGEEYRRNTLVIDGDSSYRSWLTSAMLDSNNSLIIRGMITPPYYYGDDSYGPFTQVTLSVDLSNFQVTHLQPSELLNDSLYHTRLVPLKIANETCFMNPGLVLSESNMGNVLYELAINPDVKCYTSDNNVNWTWDGFTSPIFNNHGSIQHIVKSYDSDFYVFYDLMLYRIQSPGVVDADNDSVLDIFDDCLGTGEGIEIDENGCWWGQFDDDDDGIINQEDDCPKVSTLLCGKSIGSFVLGDLFTSDGSSESLVSHINYNQIFRSNLNSPLFSFSDYCPSSENELYFPIGIYSIDIMNKSAYCGVSGHDNIFTNDGTPILENWNQRTLSPNSNMFAYVMSANPPSGVYLDPLPQSVIDEYTPERLVSKWGTHNSSTYIVDSGSSQAIVSEGISSLRISNQGDYLAWITSTHYSSDTTDFRSQIMIMNSTLQPIEVFGYEYENNMMGNNIEISHNGRFISYSWADSQQLPAPVFIIDLENNNSVFTRNCHSYSFSNKDNTMACANGTSIEVFNLISNQTIYSYPISYEENYGVKIYFSPSDTYIVLETQLDGVNIINIQTGINQKITIPDSINHHERIKLTRANQNTGFLYDETTFYISAEYDHISYNHRANDENKILVYGFDSDFDLVIDIYDNCPNTPDLEISNEHGCSPSQTDLDNDGVYDNFDSCPGTLASRLVDINGCALQQLDADDDGISDASDQCPNTPFDETVGLTGCSGSQVDTDEDGVYDSQDNCPSTPSGTTVDSAGCAPDDVVDLDSDGDGVRDSVDTCPNSAMGIIVDSTGCETIGDVQSVEDSVESSLFEDLFYGSICILLVIGVIWGGRNREKNSSYQFSTVQSEDNLELQNRISNLEREKRRTEHEMSQIKRQHSSQSSASEIQSMERQIKELQQRVSNSELSKSQLKQEMRVQQQRVSQSSAAEIAEMQEEMRALQQRVSESERAKGQLKMEIEQVKSDNIASLEMQDSVIAGDVVSSGATKIDQQTNETHSTIGIQDSAFTGDAITSGAQKIESQTNVTGFDVDAMTKLLDRERANAIETAKMAEELARLRKESGE